LKWVDLNDNAIRFIDVGDNPINVDWKDSDDVRWSPGSVDIGSETGVVHAAPTNTGTFTAWLIATDTNGQAAANRLPAENDQVLLKKWTFEVKEPAAFVVEAYERTPANASKDVLAEKANGYTDPMHRAETHQIYAVGETYRFAPISITHAQGHGRGQVTFTMSGAPPGFLIDPTTGFIQGTVQKPTGANRNIYSMQVYAVDGAGTRSQTPLETIVFDVRTGPNGKHCYNNGKIVPEMEWKGGIEVVATNGVSFTCDCNQTQTDAATKGFTGPNCENDIEKVESETARVAAEAAAVQAEATAKSESAKTEASKKKASSTTGAAVGGTIFLLLIIVAAVVVLTKRRSDAPPTNTSQKQAGSGGGGDGFNSTVTALTNHGGVLQNDMYGEVPVGRASFSATSGNQPAGHFYPETN